MNREELITKFQENHNLFLDHIKSLTDEEFVREIPEKWTAGQQLEHMVLGLAALSQALQSKDFVENTFGKINRPTWDYEKVVNTYVNGLNSGGKAPDRFCPEKVALSQKNQLLEDFSTYLDKLIKNLDQYDDHEFDTLVIPHPFLGKLSIQEMMYLMTYHALHHLKSVKENLQNHL